MIRLATAALVALICLAAPLELASPVTAQVAVNGPLSVKRAGSTGTDYSANAATVPIAGYMLLQTIPATPGRAYVEVQNQSANTIQVVRDDGNGGNLTSILLTGVGAGQQGAGTSSDTFKGRLRIYGPAGSQIAAYQD